MTQNVGNLLQWASDSKQSARKAMSEDVNSGMTPATPLIRFPDRSANYTRTDRLIVGSNVANKQGPIGCFRTLLPEVLSDRIAGCDRQWKNVDAARLISCQADDASMPVDIRQTEMCDFAGAQAQIRKTPHHSIGAFARPGQLPERIQELLNLAFCEHLWQFDNRQWATLGTDSVRC